MGGEQPPLRGIIGACLTPFGDDGSVDHQALGRQIEFLVEDVDAVAVAAVEASEWRMLGDAARRDLLRAGVELVGGRVPAIAGATADSVEGVLRWIEFAHSVGADLAQVLMPARPWSGEPGPSELVRFFEAVASRTPLPLAVYHNPGSGADPDVATYVAISEIPQVACFKESSRDIAKILRLIQEIDLAGRAAYFTTMQPLLTTLLMGGSGATMPPPATRIAARVRDAVAASDLDTAVRWQQVFSVFPAPWSRFGLTPVMKAAMGHAGIPMGAPASPYQPLDAASDQRLRRFIQGCGLLDGGVPSSEQLRALAA